MAFRYNSDVISNSFVMMSILIVHNFSNPCVVVLWIVKSFLNSIPVFLCCINTEITLEYLVNLIGNPDVSNLLCKISSGPHS